MSDSIQNVRNDADFGESTLCLCSSYSFDHRSSRHLGLLNVTGTIAPDNNGRVLFGNKLGLIFVQKGFLENS